MATGYGLLDATTARPAVVATGVITTTTDLAFEARVRLVYDGIHDVLLKHTPELVVLEDLYTEYKFPRTALLMAHVRGVVCLAAEQCGVPVLALAPAEVKRAVAFNGAAPKAQVQHAIGRLLGLAEPPSPSHVADALALAWTGLSRARSSEARQGSERGLRAGGRSPEDRAERGPRAGGRSPEDRAERGPRAGGRSPGAREFK